MTTNRSVERQEIETYAGVLLDAVKDGDVFSIDTQLGTVSDILRANTELRSTLDDSSIPASTKANIIREGFSTLDAALVSVLAVMAERGDIRALRRVRSAYLDSAEEHTGCILVDCTTAVALDDSLRKKIEDKLSRDFDGKKIYLREKVDPSILGGIVMSAHGKRIDASVLSQLENARVVLSTVPAGGEC